ncbi:hypothetical protein CH76_01940 [Lysinibacillus sp. BF-4]|uniref:DUF6710 family protein n=1 Tax=Lysinibacillus sp. BF-4 TaxID=1473546 RepID=UPI000507738F|nr:DUF6710 family protein [Lysinibacillus sp. BF-4]KFL44586.1 hypothetical protein CH76_01940 [Lysinibacillus sp. BF-4]
MRILSWLKNNVTKENEVAHTSCKDSNSYSYQHTINLVDTWLKQETEVEEKLMYIDFVMKAIRKDLQYDTLTTILYNKEHFEKRWPLLLLPHSYYDEEGKEYETDSGKERSHENNHFSTYFSSLELCYVDNGLHSTTAGIIHEKGTIMAKHVDAEALFPHVVTDGKKWVNVHTKTPYELEVHDFRFAILYTLGQKKYYLNS